MYSTPAHPLGHLTPQGHGQYGVSLGKCRGKELGKGQVDSSLPQREAVYTVPSLWLHISENDQRILNSLGPGQKAQGKEDWRIQRGVSGGLVPTDLISLS